MPKSPAKTQIDKKSQPFFSIVIPTLNEESFLPDLLNDLKSQTFNKFEVIVVDGNSIDNTVKKARIYSKSLPLKIIESKISNVASQRNIGTQHSEANWIIFMDADNRLPPFFLEGLKYNLSKYTNIDIFTCLIEPDENNISSQFIAQAINVNIIVQLKTKNYFALGAMLGVKKKLTETNSFDPKYSVGDEQVYVRKLAKQGHKFTVITDPRFICSFRRLRKDGLLKSASVHGKVLVYSFGKQSLIDKPDLYVMKGGSFYLESNESRWDIYTKKGLSKLQVKRVQKFLDYLRPN